MKHMENTFHSEKESPLVREKCMFVCVESVLACIKRRGGRERGWEGWSVEEGASIVAGADERCDVHFHY